MAAAGTRALHWGSASEAASAAEPAHALQAGDELAGDFDLNEDQRQFKHVADTFAREELAPYRCVGPFSWPLHARAVAPLQVQTLLVLKPDPSPVLSSPFRSAEWDEKHHFPVDTIKRAAELGGCCARTAPAAQASSA